MLNFLLNRLKEPSSMVSVGAALSAAGVSAPEPLLQSAFHLASGVALLAGFLMRERGKKD